ncbi:MAG TPA: ABC transporter permease subunit [Gemmataceae bacterium]|nr:ABC transporter permease subunit [Gemmataceae bacterium]
MKYLAILRDSLREAIDTWVFYVMAGLSCLLILLVASVSFRPISVAEDLDEIAGTFNWALGFQKAQGVAVPHLSHGEVRQTNPGAEPWKGDYEFTFSVEFPDQSKKFQNMTPGMFRFILQRGLSQYLDNVQVKSVTTDDPKVASFQVTSHGTKVNNLRGWKHEVSLFFGALPLTPFHAPLGEQIYFIEYWVVGNVGAWIGILVGIIVTAFFIPNMLRKGTVDMLVVKPMYRPTLLTFKYLGGLSFMLLNAALVIVGIWLVLGLRSGVWATGFLWTILILTFFFAIYYAVSTLAGVLTRSPIVAILLTCVAWGVVFGLNWGYSVVDGTRHPAKAPAELEAALKDIPEDQRPAPPASPRFPNWVYTAADVVHYVVPRTGDLSALTNRLIIKDVLYKDNPRLEKEDKTPFTWGESLAVSGAYIAVLLGLSCLWFATRDY